MLRYAADERRVSPAAGDDEMSDFLPDPLADTWEFDVPDP